jgi:hypothetical protein
MTPNARKLVDCFRRLSEVRQIALLEFAQYLADKEEVALGGGVPVTPLDIPRPEDESVIKAVRRLRATYPMLDQNKIFTDVSSQMTRHVMHGLPSGEVIDELEVIFRRHYEALVAGDVPNPTREDNSSS